MKTFLKIFPLFFLLFLFLIALEIKKAIIKPKSASVKVTEEQGGEKAMELVGKKILMVIAPSNFRDEELFIPKEILETNGGEITVASRGVTTAKGMLGKVVNVDKDLSEVNSQDFEAIIFIGGSGASTFFNDQAVLNLAKSVFKNKKVIAAICIAPSILANSGILSGKKATAFPSEDKNLKAKGAIYTGEEVTIDGKIVTAKGPEAAKEFGEAIKKLLR